MKPAGRGRIRDRGLLAFVVCSARRLLRRGGQHTSHHRDEHDGDSQKLNRKRQQDEHACIHTGTELSEGERA
jgi:hypothetical protein